MTKHFLPEPGAELIGTDYIRSDDGATMRWNGVDSFIAQPGLFKAKRDSSPTVSEDTVRPVMSELESLEQAMAESPRNISGKYVQSGLERLFKSSETHVSTIGKDRFTDGKRRVRAKGTHHTDKSTAPWRNIQITKKFKDDFADEPCLHFRFCNSERAIPKRFRCTVAWTPARRQFRDIVKSDWLWLFCQIWRYVAGYVPYLTDTVPDTVPEGLRVTTALLNRTRQKQYTVDFPPLEYPDSEIFPRSKPRNASPTREKDAGLLNALKEFRRLNESLEPLQTSYGKADCEKHVEGANHGPDDDGEGEDEGDDVAVPRADAELENRPSIEEMEARWDVPRVKYETRDARKIPVSGDVEVMGYRKGIIPGLEDAARESMTAFWKRQATEPNPYWPQAKRKTEKQIDIFVDRIAKPERLNIRDVDKSKRWSIRRIGGLRFDPYGKLGELTHYVNAKNPNRWHRVKEDVAGTPRGPEFLGSANQKDDDDMRRKGWNPLRPLMRETTKVLLSDKEVAEQWSNDDVAKRWPNEDVPERFLCRTEYYLRKRSPPALLLPYDTPVEIPDTAYAFGSTYTLPDEPADDVVERRSYLEAVNARLSPQARRVVNMVVLTDLTEELAPTYEGLGTMLCCSKVSKSTLIRLGKRAIEETAAELSVIYQALSVV